MKPWLLLVLAMPLLAEDSPLVIAHRGASGYLPEHTLAAKALAHGMGAHYLEQDIVLTQDDVPVVLHDIHLDTTTDVARRFPDRKRADGRYYALDFSLAEIKQLDVSERFNAKTGKAVYPKRFPLDQSTFCVSTLEEELQLIQGLNASTGRVAGIYPEIKQPKWHRDQGHDISRIVLPVLQRYGYATKADPCFLQCFELTEVQRLRAKLGWKGKLIMLLGSKKGEDGTDYAALRTPKGLAELAKVADGIGPAIHQVLNEAGKPTPLVSEAHAAGLKVHPYTLRADDLPGFATSPDEVHRALFSEAKVDGLFSDFPDLTVRWLQSR
jgi:glycerophosphoryl diester phosphodiesterase